MPSLRPDHPVGGRCAAAARVLRTRSGLPLTVESAKPKPLSADAQLLGDAAQHERGGFSGAFLPVTGFTAGPQPAIAQNGPSFTGHVDAMIDGSMQGRVPPQSGLHLYFQPHGSTTWTEVTSAWFWGGPNPGDFHIDALSPFLWKAPSAKTTVKIYYRAKKTGAWHYLKAVTTGSNGGFTYSLTHQAHGYYHAVFPQNGYYQSSTSSTVYFGG